MKNIRDEVGDERFQNGKYEEAGELFSAMTLGSEEFAGGIPDFLTLPAYKILVEQGD